jgi:hypothetical protein
VLVPVAGDKALFAGRRWQGTRYLIVTRKAAQVMSGNLVELLLRRNGTPTDTLALLTNLYRGLVKGQPVAPAQEEGFVMLYSADYRYLTGRQFRDGRILPGASQLVFRPYKGNGSSTVKGTQVQSRTTSDVCTDWYDGNTGAYITTTGNCNFYVDNGGYDPGGLDYGNGGTPADILSGPGGYGGGGGGGDGGNAGVVEVLSTDSQLPPCADKVLVDLKTMAINSGTQSGLLGAILRAVGNSGKISLHFAAGPITPLSNGTQIAGNCQYNSSASTAGRRDFTITVNQQYLNGPSTDLFISQILLHEILHAALTDWQLQNGSSANGVSFDDALAYWIAQQGLTPGDGLGQHNAMSLLVDQLGAALYQYYLSVDHSTSLGAQYHQLTSLDDCKALSWTGLEGSIGYQWAALNVPGFVDRCNAIQGAEITGNWTASGSQANNTLVERYPAGKDPCP